MSFLAWVLYVLIGVALGALIGFMWDLWEDG